MGQCRQGQMVPTASVQNPRFGGKIPRVYLLFIHFQQALVGYTELAPVSVCDSRSLSLWELVVQNVVMSWIYSQYWHACTPAAVVSCKQKGRKTIFLHYTYLHYSVVPGSWVHTFVVATTKPVSFHTGAYRCGRHNTSHLQGLLEHFSTGPAPQM
jgi:hypothetical protein